MIIFATVENIGPHSSMIPIKKKLNQVPSSLTNLALAILSGVLLALAFPPLKLWFLGWIGVIPLIIMVRCEKKHWRSFLWGTLSGSVFYLISSSWVTYSMNVYGGIPLWESYIFALIIAFILGAFTGLAVLLFSLAVRRIGESALLVIPFCWVAGEYARSLITGIGWNSLGYSQAFHPLLIQPVKAGGVYLVSAIMVAVNSAIAGALIYKKQKYKLWHLVFTVLALSIFIGYGLIPRTKPCEAGHIEVDVIQPVVPISAPWDDPEFAEGILREHLDLSESDSSLKPGGPPDKIVVWPESSAGFDWDEDPALRHVLSAFTRRNNVYLLFNGWGPSADGGSCNSAYLIAPSGDKISRYDKISLLPFGEYVPGRNWIPLMNRVPVLVYDVKPGTNFIISDVAGVKIGVFICFEAIVPDIARRMRLAGAGALVQLSNEAWFGPSAAADQMLAHTVFRAVENDVELIRSTNSGRSAYISSDGRISDVTPMFEQAVREWKIC